MPRTLYDIAIIGAGPAGCRIAKNLTKKSLDVVLIEAGPNVSKTPISEVYGRFERLWLGGLGRTESSQMEWWSGLGIGGSSFIEDGSLESPSNETLNEWRAITKSNCFEESHFRKVEREVLSSVNFSEVPTQFEKESDRVFKKILEYHGFNSSPERIAGEKCAWEDSKNCLSCQFECTHQKRWSPQTDLNDALSRGLHLKLETEVDSIFSKKNEVEIFAVNPKAPERIFAKKVVLCGGVSGNVPILVQSGHLETLPSLGTSVGTLPEFYSIVESKFRIDSYSGPISSVRANDKKFLRAGFQLTNRLPSPVELSRMIPSVGVKHQKKMQKYPYLSGIAVRVRDESNAVMGFDPQRGRFLKKELTDRDLKRRNAGFTLVEEACGTFDTKSVLSIPQGHIRHLTGGCSIGTSSNHSVVDENFLVHGSKNVYVADSSLIPSSPECVPILTTLIIAETFSKEILN